MPMPDDPKRLPTAATPRLEDRRSAAHARPRPAGRRRVAPWLASLATALVLGAADASAQSGTGDGLFSLPRSQDAIAELESAREDAAAGRSG